MKFILEQTFIKFYLSVYVCYNLLEHSVLEPIIAYNYFKVAYL